mgnify:CR=1
MSKPKAEGFVNCFVVLTTANFEMYDYGNRWYPLHNSWGYPYSIKGFAINRAKSFATFFKKTHEPFSKVLNLNTGEEVWKSWKEN